MINARRRILVVEDDPETAAQLVDSLSGNGYRVDLAADGDDGLSRGIDFGARGSGNSSTHPNGRNRPSTSRATVRLPPSDMNLAARPCLGAFWP